MRRNTGCWWPMVVAVLALGIAQAPPAIGADAPPSYQLQYLGVGSPTAINDSGTVVGIRVTGSYYLPLVSSAGSAWAVLPVPAGALSTLPTDINDQGVIVGVSYDAQMAPGQCAGPAPAAATRWPSCRACRATRPRTPPPSTTSDRSSARAARSLRSDRRRLDLQ